MPSLLRNTLLTSVKKLTFNTEDVGWHLIKVSARVKSEKQRGKNKTDDEELMVRIDNKIFPKYGGRNYNQFDQTIQEPVSFWNEFFSKQTYPPTEPLGPNLIKAIVYRESILGYFPNEDIIDVMQVWDAENPAQDTILGKSPANEFVNENQYQHMSYSYPENKVPPQVKTPEESIFWGVRFLYHKAQEFTGAGENGLNSPYGRIWVSWEEAVRRYNANPKLKEEYIEEVFSIYRNGIDAKGITLWPSTETE